MKCKKFQKEIERYLEGEMESADKALVEKHISECALCADFFREAREEVSLYKEALSGFRLSDSLKEGVLSRLRVISAPRREYAVTAEVKRWHIFSLSAAAAALFIFAFWASFFGLPVPARPSAQEPVQVKKEEPASGAVFETSLVRVHWKVQVAPYHYYRGGESAG
jgi:predicted anti-sigma-YlaC factor YlaD